MYDDDDRPERNGIRAPKPGGECYRAWCLLFAMYDGVTPPDRQKAMEIAAQIGLSPGNVGIEYGHWCRFAGIPAEGPFFGRRTVTRGRLSADEVRSLFE